MHTQGGAHTRRCTQKAVCSSAGVLLFKGARGGKLRHPLYPWGGGGQTGGGAELS